MAHKLTNILLAFAIFILACSTEITSSNPYDPDSPKTIQARGIITGKINPEDFTDLKRVNFTATVKDTSYNAIVEKDGSFTIKDIEKGTYYLRVISSDSAYYESEIGPITVNQGQTTNVGNINLSFKKGIVRGFIKKPDASGKTQIGVGNARISLVSFETRSGFLMSTQVNNCNSDIVKSYDQFSEADGSFEFKNVKAGTYKLSSIDEVNGLGFFNDTVVVKENQELNIGVVNFVPPSALIRIEDENKEGSVISVTKNNKVKVVFYYGDFLKEYRFAVNDSVDNAGWEDLNQYRYKLVDLSEEGYYNINVIFRDILCRETPIYSARVFYDKTPPQLNEIRLPESNEGYINKDNLKVVVSVQDNYSDYKSLRMRKIIVNEEELKNQNVDSSFFENHQIGYSNFSAEFVEPITGSSGKKVLLIQFSDEAGNESEVYREDFYFDNIMPEIGIKVDGAKNINGTDIINSSFVNLNITNIAPDKVAPIDKIKVFYNEDPEPEQWDIYTPLYPVMLPVRNGSVNIKVRVMDKAKNISNVATSRIMVDTDPPQISLIKINGDSKYTNKTKVNIEISGQDIDEMIISNNFDFSGASWIPYNSIINDYDIGSTEGVHNIYFKFKDVVGNETNTMIGTITLDTIPPCDPEDIVIANSRYSIEKNKYFVNNNTPIFSWQYICSDESEIEKFKIEIKSGSDTIFSDYAYSNNIMIPYIKDGEYLVRIYSVDKAGNMSIWPKDDINLVIDTVPPTSPKIKKIEYTKTKLPEYDICPFLGYIDIDISVMPDDDNLTDFKFQISGGFDEDCFYLNWFTDINTLSNQMIDEDTIRFYVPKNDISTLLIRAVDEAGNYSDADFITIVEDSKAPEYVQNIKGENNDSKVLISWEPPVADKDVGGYLIYYGYNTYSLNGNFANEGHSPINVQKPCFVKDGKELCQFWLTGVPDGTPFLVDIAAYDDTRPQPNIGSITYQPVSVVAGIISPDLIKEVSGAEINATIGSTFEAVEERDGLVYVTTGNKNGNGGLFILDISRPSNPVLLGHIIRPQFKTMHQLKLSGRYAFVANGENGVVIFDISKPDDIKIVKEIPVASETFAVGLEKNDGYLFVATNAPIATPDNSKLLIYDITDISNPQLVNTIPVPIQNIQAIALQGDYIYLGSLGQILYLDIKDVNNIQIKQINGVADAIDVSWNMLYTLDAVNANIYEYNNGAGSFAKTKSFSTNSIGLNLVVDGPYLYTSTNDGIRIYSNFGNNEFLSYIPFGNYGHLRHTLNQDQYFYITHNDIKISGTLLIVSYYNSYSDLTGLKIFSLVNPRNPRKMSEYSPQELSNKDVSVYKDIVLVLRSGFLEINRHIDNFSLTNLLNEQINYTTKNIQYYDNRLLVTNRESIFLYRFDINNISKQAYIINNPANSKIISATVRDNYLFVGIDNNSQDEYSCIEEIQIVDIRDMSLKNSVNVGACPSTTKYYQQNNAFAFYANYMYVAASGRGIQIYDISNIESFILKNTYLLGGAEYVQEIAVYGRDLYYSSTIYVGGLLRAILSDPENPEFKNLVYSNSKINRIIPSGEFVYAGSDSLNSYYFLDNEGGIYSIFNNNTYGVMPFITGNIAYISNLNRGVMVLKLE